MTVKTYTEIPSSAINSIEINSDKNTVTIQYKSSEKKYEYNTESAEEFEQQYLTEIRKLGKFTDKASIGKFVNQSVNNGTLTLLAD